jgi:hypothetical protein
MLILSTTFLFFAVMSSQSTESYMRRGMTIYAEETSKALMSSTVPEASYTDKFGTLVDRTQGNTMVEYLLLEELGLMDDGVPTGNFGGYEGPIKAQANALIVHQYYYALRATYQNNTPGAAVGVSEIFLTNGYIEEVDGTYTPITSMEDVPRLESVAFSWSQPMLSPQKYGKAQLEFVIWRID